MNPKPPASGSSKERAGGASGATAQGSRVFPAMLRVAGCRPGLAARPHVHSLAPK